MRQTFKVDSNYELWFLRTLNQDLSSSLIVVKLVKIKGYKIHIEMRSEFHGKCR